MIAVSSRRHAFCHFPETPAGSHSQLAAARHQLESLGVKITRLVSDSREVQAGDTFVAYPGSRVDGRQFIAQAIANGANAVIWEAHDFIWNKGWQIPNLAIAGLLGHVGDIADQVYGSPSRKLWMTGVTGTNGKTSCSHWVAQAFTALNKKTALLGTLGNGFPTALLTLAGYSLTDTVVVYDRIRENQPLRPRDSQDQVMNSSINEVLSRTIVTSLTLFLVCAALVFFGGEVLHDFSLALLIGIVIGTYSSIFVASPIVYEWRKG